MKKIQNRWGNLRHWIGSLIGVLILIISAVTISGSVVASTSPRLTFGQFVVQGLFLDFYNKNPDRLLFYGEPISNEFMDPGTHILVQYFQRARFELVDGGVRLTPLGKLLLDSFSKDDGSQVVDEFSGTGCRVFKNEIPVCLKFLEFYDSYSEYLGEPISKVLRNNDNLFVQYFENARLEWRADKVGGERVVVSYLGQFYYDIKPHQPDPNPNEAKSANIQSPSGIVLQMHAFVLNSLLPASGEQVVFVVVQDGTNQPVKGVIIRVVPHLSDDSQITKVSIAPPDTDENGISVCPFKIQDVPLHEIIHVSVYGSYKVDGSTPIPVETTTWFRIWW
jgi:hypothetical protein